MAKIPAEVQEAFTRVRGVVLGTADKLGQPNGCVVAMKKVIDDETVYLSDQFFKKTLANLEVNPKVSIAFWDDESAYQIHGTAQYVNEGAEGLGRRAVRPDGRSHRRQGRHLRESRCGLRDEGWPDGGRPDRVEESVRLLPSWQWMGRRPWRAGRPFA